MTIDALAACRACARLVAYREANAARLPDHFNAPVGRLGPPSAPLLIVGLAPGLHGANRTGVPFTGDASGHFLFAGLARFGLTVTGDGKVAIVNAVACCPPENRPVAAEIRNCRRFLAGHLDAGARAVLTLGGVAHNATLDALGVPRKTHPFRHAATSDPGGRRIVSSYHPSRYNVQTGRLTDQMFDEALALWLQGERSSPTESQDRIG